MTPDWFVTVELCGAPHPTAKGITCTYWPGHQGEHEAHGQGYVWSTNRESGGSLPAECPCGEGKNPLHALLKSHGRPESNKSGGPDVEEK